MATEDTINNIREKQRNLLVERLAELRERDKADVVLVTGEVEFYAHKLVLEAVSPYFVTLFKSRRDESAVEKISFNDVAADTLDAILDFIYLGEMRITKTQVQVTNVLHAAFMMQLNDLVKYCCNDLLQMLSPDNFLGIWMMCQQYGNERMLDDILNFIIHNLSEVLNTNTFHFVTIGQLKALLNYANDKLTDLDKLLLGLFEWLKFDGNKRCKFFAELLGCIDAKVVSSQCLKSLLEDPGNKEIIQNNFELFERLNLGCGQLLVPKQEESLPTNNVVGLSSRKMTFFAQHNIDDASNCSEKGSTAVSYVQQFDLSTMSWLPAVKLPDSFQFKVHSLCQYNDCLCLVGSEMGASYALYDIKQNTVEYVSCEYNASREKAALCYFKNCIFLIGGRLRSGVATSSVHYVPITRKRNWCATSRLTKALADPTCLTTDQTLYVTGGHDFSHDFLTVDCTTGPQLLSADNMYSVTWATIHVSNVVSGLKAHVLLLSDMLYCHYVIQNDSKEMTQKPKRQLRGLLPPERSADVKSFLHFPGKNDTLFATTSEDKLGIPNFLCKVESEQWVKLIAPKGKCEIGSYENILPVNTTGI